MVIFRRFCCCLLLFYCLSLPAAPQLYRCVDAAGDSIFQQTTCLVGEQSIIEVVDTRVGWKPPKASKKSTKASKKPPRSTAKQARERRKQDKSCWRAEQNLEQVDRKLRRGYKASAGDRLRAKQERYESYLKEFC
jgi:hypothetical protein